MGKNWVTCCQTSQNMAFICAYSIFGGIAVILARRYEFVFGFGNKNAFFRSLDHLLSRPNMFTSWPWRVNILIHFINAVVINLPCKEFKDLAKIALPS